MEFDPGEREYLLDQRMLTTDVHGHEVYTGLTVEESAEFFALTRRETMEAGRQSAAERDRYLALNAKVQAAKFEVIGAEIVLDRSKPTRN